MATISIRKGLKSVKTKKKIRRIKEHIQELDKKLQRRKHAL